ncbi:hypothetical protein [Paraburkholderia sp. SIMBA_030]
MVRSLISPPRAAPAPSAKNRAPLQKQWIERLQQAILAGLAGKMAGARVA